MDLFNLAAKLSLDSKNFTDGLKKADKQGENFAKKLTKSFNTISKVAKTVLGGVVVKQVIGSLTKMANATAAFGDAIDKNSQVLGMSRKAYQQWDFILSQNGASIDDMTTAMRTMNSAITEKSPEVLEALEQLGIDLGLLGSLSVEDQFDYLVNQFQQMPAGATKSAIAVKLFGRQGQQLLPLLNQTSQDTYALKEKMEELGLYMSDKGVNASVAYNDAMDTMKRTFAALKNRIVEDILPSLTAAIERITVYASDIKKAYEEGGVAGVFSKLADDIKAAFSKIWINIRANISWEKLKKIGEDIIAKIESGITQIKVNLAERLGMTDESGNPLEPTSITWTGLGKALITNVWTGVQEWNNTAKGWLADKLGFTEEEKNSATWLDIGKAVISEVWNGISEWSNTAKGWLLGKLGIDSEVSGTSWFDIGRVIIGRIWNGLQGWSSTVKGWLASKLGIDSEEKETDWLTIGKTIIERISNGVQSFSNTAKGWLVDKLGIKDEVTKTSWFEIGRVIISRIYNGIQGWSNSAKNWLSEKLGITNSSGKVDASWSDIGKELFDKMFEFLGTGGGFLKKLILGSDFTDKSTWSDVADKVFGWITEALDGKDLIGMLFNNAVDKASGIITFAGNVLSAIADWIGQHSDEIASMLTTVFKSVIDVAGSLLTEIVPVLVKLFTNPQLLEGIGTLVGEILSQIIKLLSDPSTYEALVKAIISIVKGVKNALTETIVEPILEDLDTESGKKNLGKKIVATTALAAGYVTVKEAEPFGGNKEAVKEAQAEFYKENGIFGINKGTFSAIGAGIQKTWEDVKDVAIVGAAVLDSTFTKAGDLLGSGLEWAAEKTDEAAAALASAIAAAATSVWNAIGGGGGGGGGSPYLGYGAEENAHPYVRPHAKGLWYVPYDGYIAKLHRGERIQTASQARHDNGGGASAGDIAAAVKAAVSEAMANLSITLDKKIVGKVMGDTVSSRVHDNINFANAQTAYSHGR